MAGFSIKVTVNDESVRRSFAELSRKGRNLRHVLDVIGAELVASTEKRFSDQRDPDGKPWTPLAPSTLLGRAGKNPYTKKGTLRKRAQRRMEMAQILIGKAPAHLVHSLTHQADDAAVAVGTNIPYSRIHQLGGDAGRGHAAKIPARPYLGISRSDRDSIGKRLAGYLAGG